VWLQTLMLALHTHSFTWPNHVVIWGIFPVTYAMFLLLSVMDSFDEFGIMTNLQGMLSACVLQ
jgi:hypothetical protein